MPHIKAFKAVHYNKEKVGDYKKVVSPPYDIISDDEQTLLHNLSPYNFTHIDLGKDRPSDDRGNNKYTRAKAQFEDWLRKEVMVEDSTPCIYFYRQEYKIQGQKFSRMGFIGLMELQDESESKVYPHENTHASAVEDRLKLTTALNAGLSCIFVCYSDRTRNIEKIFTRQVMPTEPMIDVLDKDGIHHKLWRLSDPALIKEIDDSLSNQQLFIADGHHRYKMAMEYRKNRKDKRSAGASDSYNYVMTYFTNLDSKDLQIFPMHRIITKLPKPMDFLEEIFRIDRIKSKNEMVILLTKAGANEHAFVLYTREGMSLLRLKNQLLINDRIKEGSKDFKNLDATILKHFVFDRVGIQSSDIVYTKNTSDVYEMVDSGAAQCGFIMNAVRIQQLKAIALNGERMPPKTTYFFPKVLSGLTVYKMD